MTPTATTIRGLMLGFAALGMWPAGDGSASAQTTESNWVRIFNGRNLDGWVANSDSHTWTVQDGAITSGSGFSHLFYTREQCADCEFKAEVRINHGGNSGIYFRSQMTPQFPAGYEAQVNNTALNLDRTGSLYGFVSVRRQIVPDDTWWTHHIIFSGNHIRILVNGLETVNYRDTANTYTNGYFALQQFQEGTVVQYRNLMMRRLPPPPTPTSPAVTTGDARNGVK